MYRITEQTAVWQGNYQNQNQLWLRWWDSEGNLLLTGVERSVLQQMRTEQAEERAQQAESLVQQEREQAQQAQQDAISRLLAMGLSAEQVNSSQN